MDQTSFYTKKMVDAGNSTKHYRLLMIHFQFYFLALAGVIIGHWLLSKHDI